MSAARSGSYTMSEAAVLVIVGDALKEYERETGLPRHKENLGNFKSLFELVSQIRGGVRVLRWVIGLPALVMAIISILRYVRGH
jgi:hypothetical protein